MSLPPGMSCAEYREHIDAEIRRIQAESERAAESKPNPDPDVGK